MTIAWIWQSLIVGALVAGAALGIEGFARVTRRPVRWVWLGALALTVLLMAVAPFRTRPAPFALVRTERAAPVTAESTPNPTEWSMSSLYDALQADVTSAGSFLARPPRILGRVGSGTVARVLLGLWGAASLLLLGLGYGIDRRFRRARARWPLAEVEGVQVRIAPETGPAVIGIRRPEIVVPRWLTLREPEEQRLVLTHELEHIRARDGFTFAAGWAAIALVPWHPAIWWMASRLRTAVELDCDMRVLNHGVVPRRYGSLLIDLAAQCGGLGGYAVAFTDRPTQLERRLTAMTDINSTGRRIVRVRAGALGVLALGALVLACESRVVSDPNADSGNSQSGLQATPIGLQATPAGVFQLRQDTPGLRGAPDRRIVEMTDRPARLHPRTIVDTASSRGPLFVVDSVALRGVSLKTSDLDTMKVERIEVIRGSAARRLYPTEPQAANGVIQITTKH